MNRREFIYGMGAVSLPLLPGSKLYSDALYQPNLPPLATITVGGVEFHPASPPKQFRNYPDLGIMVNRGMSALRVWAHEPPDRWCGESRCIKTPGGDYLLMLTLGRGHYGNKLTKVNDMVALRSSDRGKTWTGPKVAWDIPYNQHGFVPLVPHGSKRIYAFGTEPIFSMFDRPENAPIGFRHSDDDGHTWSDVTLIRPANDPDFRGMFVMRMCETGKGTWLLAPHTGDNYQKNSVRTRLYIMRSADQGKSWMLLPHPRPDGWNTPGYNQLEEGRPISLGGPKVLIIARSSEGHLWKLRSDDDGQTWKGPDSTPMVHPLAPPMVTHLSDGKTLASFYHNRNTRTSTGIVGSAMNRSELWVSLSSDEGETWSEPRFVMANSGGGGTMGSFADYSVSYVDLLVDGHEMHIIFSHQFRQVLHVWFDQKMLHRLPTQAELKRF